jgi:PAS domain S-box-containing protein
MSRVDSKPYLKGTPEDFERIFRAIMDYSQDGIFVTDHAGNIVMMNKASEVLNDCTAAEVLGRNVRDLVREGFYDRSVSLEVLKQKRVVSLIQVSRNRKKVLATGIPIFDDRGRIKYVLVNDRDITLIQGLIEKLEAGDVPAEKCRLDFSRMSRTITELQEFVIESPKMIEVIQAAVRAAKYDLAVVLRGESGVGKSMLAKLIHRLSERRNGPFVHVNCGAIAESLLESELFGYEKGAFTGANPGGKKGRLELADGGTLFLDEIGELPLPLQVKFLRFLESYEIIRLGGSRAIDIDARVIAATHQDLEEMVNRGAFRSDLYFRLNVVPIHIPLLAERREEIAPLAAFFLERFNRRFGTRKKMSRSALNALGAYDFPGNVRELENLTQRLVTMTEGDRIGFEELPEILFNAHHNGTGAGARRTPSHKESIRRLEEKMIQRAVAQYGSQRKAAKALGLSQSTLSRKLSRPKKRIVRH